MPHYVGMTRKQNSSYNASISIQTLIFHLVVNSTHPKTVLWCCPNSKVGVRLLENVVKVTNLEVVKIEFRHLNVRSHFVSLRNSMHVMRPRLVSFAVAISTSQACILDSGARRISLLPAHLHGGSPTCCSGSGSLQV